MQLLYKWSYVMRAATVVEGGASHMLPAEEVEELGLLIFIWTVTPR